MFCHARGALVEVRGLLSQKQPAQTYFTARAFATFPALPYLEKSEHAACPVPCERTLDGGDVRALMGVLLFPALENLMLHIQNQLGAVPGMTECRDRVRSQLHRAVGVWIVQNSTSTGTRSCFILHLLEDLVALVQILLR